MCRAFFVIVSLMINVTPNLKSVCKLLKGLHIVYYVHNLVYSRLFFIGIIIVCVIIYINVIIICYNSLSNQESNTKF